MLHLCNGAANIKKIGGNKILVPNVSFSSPNGETGLLTQLQWWYSVIFTILLWKVEQC
jgi:hypothetical protein